MDHSPFPSVWGGYKVAILRSIPIILNNYCQYSLTNHRSYLLIIVENKLCKCIISLKNLLTKLEASVYSHKRIKCTIFQNQSVTAKIEEYPSEQSKPETKLMVISCQGTAYIPTVYSFPTSLCYLPLSIDILHICWCMLPPLPTSMAYKT